MITNQTVLQATRNLAGNPAETGLLVRVADNIWIADGHCVRFYGCPYPTRSVIVRLASGGLWVWSPVELTHDLKACVESLGQPQFLISPNKIHHLFLTEWHAAYPQAALCGPASTIQKRTDIDFTVELTDRVPEDWAADFDQVWFNGSFVMDEIVFFHRPSKTVVLADLAENFGAAFLRCKWKWWQRVGARLGGITEGKGHAPLDWRVTFHRRKATRQARDRVLAWNPDKVIMAHGVWQSSDGGKFLEKSFSWI